MKHSLNYFTVFLSRYLNNVFCRSQNIQLYIFVIKKLYYIKHCYNNKKKILLWTKFQIILSNKITIYRECVNSVSNPVFRLSSIMTYTLSYVRTAHLQLETIASTCIKLRDVLVGLVPFSTTKGKPRHVVLWESNYENIYSVNL